MKKIISILISMYISVIGFYGVIIKLTLGNSILFKIKTFVPEMILVMIIIISAIDVINTKKLKIKNRIMFWIVIYLVGIFFMNLFTDYSAVGVLYTLRDLILPILAMYSLMQIDFTTQDIKKLKNTILKILISFVVLGCILACTQQVKGWEWTARFYTNYTFYGLDPISKVKIWHGHGFLRTPSITGNSVTFGIYSLFSYIMIKHSNLGKTSKFILCIMSIVSMLMSTSKTVILTFMILFVFDLSNKFKSYVKVSSLILFILTLIIFIGNLIYKDADLIMSTFERFTIWAGLTDKINLVNFIIPMKLFSINASAEGGLAFLDNTYLYFAVATGIWGLMLIIYFLTNLLKLYKNNIVLKNMVFIFILTSAFLNITQGRSYFSIFCIAIPMLIKCKEYN